MVFRRIPKFADDCRRFPKKPEDVSNIYHIFLRVQSPESRVQSPESRVQSSPESSPGFRLCRASLVITKVFIRDNSCVCSSYLSANKL